MRANYILPKEYAECISAQDYDQWEKWFDAIVHLEGDWLYRGQVSNSSLKTTLELDCNRSGFRPPDNADNIERNMIRQFQRVYDMEDQQIVKNDMLYCISLMRHYGAPTRLLDFTYSRYLAIYFGLEAAYRELMPNDTITNCTVWCINQQTLKDRVSTIKKVGKLIDSRRDDEKRDDNSFIKLYMNNEFTFVIWENPLKLHRRLHLQQGTFLCPGNIKIPLMDNLLVPFKEQPNKFIKQFTCTFSPKDLQEAFHKFMRMGITRESLFPRIDGLCQSMGYQLLFYDKLHNWRERNRD